MSLPFAHTRRPGKQFRCGASRPARRERSSKRAPDPPRVASGAPEPVVCSGTETSVNAARPARSHPIPHRGVQLPPARSIARHLRERRLGSTCGHSAGLQSCFGSSGASASFCVVFLRKGFTLFSVRSNRLPAFCGFAGAGASDVVCDSEVFPAEGGVCVSGAFVDFVFGAASAPGSTA
jgi:hypothetical protein